MGHRVMGFLPANFQFPLPVHSRLKAFFNGVDELQIHRAPQNTVKLLLAGPYYNFRRYFNKYRSFSEFAEFPEVGKIAASLDIRMLKSFQLQEGLAP